MVPGAIHDVLRPSTGNRWLKSCMASLSRTPSRTQRSTRHSSLARIWRCNRIDTWWAFRAVPVASLKSGRAEPSRTARTSRKMVDASHHSKMDRYVAVHIAAQCSTVVSNDGLDSTTAAMARTLAATSLGDRTITIRSADCKVGHDGIVWLKRGSFRTKGRAGTSSARRAASASHAVVADGPTNAPSHHKWRGGRSVPSSVSRVPSTSSFAALTSRSSKNPFGFAGEGGINLSPAWCPARTNASASMDVPLRGAPEMTTEVTCSPW